MLAVCGQLILGFCVPTKTLLYHQVLSPCFCYFLFTKAWEGPEGPPVLQPNKATTVRATLPMLLGVKPAFAARTMRPFKSYSSNCRFVTCTVVAPSSSAWTAQLHKIPFGRPGRLLILFSGTMKLHRAMRTCDQQVVAVLGPCVELRCGCGCKRGTHGSWRCHQCKGIFVRRHACAAKQAPAAKQVPDAKHSYEQAQLCTLSVHFSDFGGCVRSIMLALCVFVSSLPRHHSCSSCHYNQHGR